MAKDDLEGSNYGLMDSVSKINSERHSEIPINSGYDGGYPGQNSNLEPPKYKPRALSPHKGEK